MYQVVTHALAGRSPKLLNSLYVKNLLDTAVFCLFPWSLQLLLTFSAKQTLQLKKPHLHQLFHNFFGHFLISYIDSVLSDCVTLSLLPKAAGGVFLKDNNLIKTGH